MNLSCLTPRAGPPAVGRLHVLLALRISHLLQFVVALNAFALLYNSAQGLCAHLANLSRSHTSR